MTIRVLHVVATGTLRGAEMFAADLVRALNGADLSQRVAILRSSGRLDVSFGAPTALLPADGTRIPGLRVDVRTLRALRALIRHWPPHVVQAHGGEALKYLALATPGPSTPVVYRRIGSAVASIARGPRRAVYAALIRHAARVIAVSEAVRRQTIEVFWVPPERVITIPQAIDPLRLQPVTGRRGTRDALAIAQDAPVVLSLGALTREKDPLSHIEVSRRVLSEIPEAIHLIAGDGPMRHEVESAVRRLRLEGRVLVLGARADVADLLLASDVVLLASRTEGMPGCLIEGGMLGRPAVAYSIAGVPEVVVDGVTGLLAPLGDLDSLTGHLLNLLRDGNARDVMGRGAREWCGPRFDIRTVAPRYLAIYEALAT